MFANGAFSKLTKLADKAVGKVKTTIRGGAGNGNARNNATVQEMKLFKEHVKELVRMVQECSLTLTTTSAGMGKVLSQQLPRAYVYSATSGGVEPFGPDVQVGNGVQLELMASAAADMQSKINAEVIQPLEKWLAAFSAIKDRNHKAEDLSTELLAQRKSTAAAEESARELQTKGHPKAEPAAQKARAEKEKEKRMEEQFFVMEAQIFNDMLVSVREIMELRKYALTALTDLQACLQQSIKCFDASVPIVIKLPSAESITPPAAGPAQDLYAAPSYPSHGAADQADEPPLPNNPFVGAALPYVYAQPGAPGGGPAAHAMPDAPPYPGMYGAPPPAYQGYAPSQGDDHPPTSYQPAQAGGYPPPSYQPPQPGGYPPSHPQ